MLRLHPPVPFEIKVCVEEDVWPDGTVVPARSGVTFNIYAMGRDPSRWEEPLAVRPERWMNDADDDDDGGGGGGGGGGGVGDDDNDGDDARRRSHKKKKKTTSKKKMPSAFEFPVFQAGPRICLGVNMVRVVLTCMKTRVHS
jgi:cytochrome P450